MRKEKEKLSEFERYKLKIEMRKKANAILGVLIVTLLAAGLVVGFGMFSSSQFGIRFRARFTEDTHFPRPISGSNVLQLEALGWDVAVLGGTQVSVYNTKGEETLSISHGYASPVAKSNGSRLLIYDQGGTKFEVTSSTRELFFGDAGGSIHAADISAEGSVALATSSTRSATLVTIYDSLGEKRYTWTSSGMVSAVALSSDARHAAVSVLSSSGGGIVTTVYLLDLTNPDPQKPNFMLEIPDEFGYDIYFQGSYVTLLTDQSVKSIDSGGKIRQSYNFDGQQLMLSRHTSNGTVLALGNEQYMRGTQIVTLDSRCREEGSITLEHGVDALMTGDQGFYLLSESVVTHYDSSCQELSSTKAPGAIVCLPLGQDLYVATYEELQKLSIR